MKLEDSTPVMVRTKQDLSSARAKVGDRLAFRVVKDVKVADLIVIPRGADAWGLVTAVQLKRRKGRPGSLTIAIQTVQLLTGENVPLRAEQQSSGKSRDVATVADVLDPRNAIFFGVTIPIELFTMLEKGRDARLPVGTKFTAYLNGDVALDRIALERVQPALVQRTGPATVTIFSLGIWGHHPPVYCGKVALAKLSDSAYLKIQLPPGKYFFHSSDEQVVEVRLEEGQEFYLGMALLFVHKRGAKGHLVRFDDDEEAEERIGHLDRLADEKVTKVSDANLAELKAPPALK